MYQLLRRQYYIGYRYSDPLLGDHVPDHFPICGSYSNIINAFRVPGENIMNSNESLCHHLEGTKPKLIMPALATNTTFWQNFILSWLTCVYMYVSKLLYQACQVHVR